MKSIKSGVYKTVDLEKILGNKMAIPKAVDRGELYNVSHGFYRTPDLEDEMEVSAKIVEKYFPEAVVSRQTALVYYGLFNDPGSYFNVDVPANSSALDNKGILTLHRSKRAHSGVTKAQVNNAKIRIYSPARAVFEVLAIGGYEPDVNQVLGNFIKQYGQKGVSEMGEYKNSFGKDGEKLHDIAKRLLELRSVF